MIGYSYHPPLLRLQAHFDSIFLPDRFTLGLVRAVNARRNAQLHGLGFADSSFEFCIIMPTKKLVDRLFPKDHWDRPEPGATGDSDERELFTAIGQALSAWEYIEDRLADMCVTFASIRQHDHRAESVIRRLFGSINTSSDRRKAMKATSELYFWPHDKDKFMSKKLEILLVSIASASRLRDDIAHGIVSSFYSGDRSIGIFLVPTGYRTDRNWGVPRPMEFEPGKSEFPWEILPGQYRYNSSAVNSIRDKFEELANIVIKHDSEFSTWKVGVILASTPHEPE